jgi:Protein of unknown function (DUF2914)
LKNIISMVLALSLCVPLLALSAGSVSEAKLGKNIVEREISEETSTFALNDKAYLWMRVVDGKGETVTVTWSAGEQTYDVPLSIGSDSWRTWSSKILHIAGEWTVTVKDSAGATLHQSSLTVQ